MPEPDLHLPILEGCEVVLRESTTDRDGRVVYAKDFGLDYFILIIPTLPDDQMVTSR